MKVNGMKNADVLMNGMNGNVEICVNLLMKYYIRICVIMILVCLLCFMSGFYVGITSKGSETKVNTGDNYNTFNELPDDYDDYNQGNIEV